MTEFYRKQKYDFFPYHPPLPRKYYINQAIFPIRKPSVRTDARRSRPAATKHGMRV